MKITEIVQEIRQGIYIYIYPPFLKGGAKIFNFNLLFLAPPFLKGGFLEKGGYIYMSYFNKFIYLIILFKIIFIILAVSHLYLKTNNIYLELDENIVYWKARIDFIFTFFMAILLIYLFHPIYDHMSLINTEVKYLLYLFGFLLLLTAKWSVFFQESIWFMYLQKSVGK